MTLHVCSSFELNLSPKSLKGAFVCLHLHVCVCVRVSVSEHEADVNT